MVPFLPALLRKASGEVVRIRNIKESDCEWIYTHITSLTSAGDGFGLDEYPTLEFYKRIFLHTHYTLIFEDLKNGCRPISICQGRPSYFTRYKDTKFMDQDIFILPGYTGKGYAAEFMQTTFSIFKDLGYCGTLTDTLVDNPITFATQRKLLKWNYLGSLPNCTYKRNLGWVDTLFTFFDYGWIQGFQEKENVTILTGRL